jgi:hypothetical protein
MQKSANFLAKFAPSYHLMDALIAFSCIYAHLATKQIVEVRLYDLRNSIANCDLSYSWEVVSSSGCEAMGR